MFPFFSDTKNLELITPKWLNFKVADQSTQSVEHGTLINYNLKLKGLPIKWRTEITAWSPPDGFVDNQLKGPYSRWHHTHSFSELAGGTLMEDRVAYRLPLGALGRLVAGSFVANDVKKIFAYRKEVIEEMAF